MFEIEGTYPILIPEFQEFVTEHYHLSQYFSRHWSEIILFFESSEEKAFDKYYELLDLYFEEKWLPPL